LQQFRINFVSIDRVVVFNKMTMTPDQLRAGRALLHWTQGKLSEASGVSRGTLADFESGKRVPFYRTVDDLRRTLESAGVVFLEETGNGDGPGVRLRRHRLAPSSA
jgi:transcriptional regulator with XRE-family HTH domain